MYKSSFFIIGQHAVIEALKNPDRKVLKLFLTEESKKNIHRKNPKKNLLAEVKVYFKTKKELDKYSTRENLQHQGYVAEVEHVQKPILKEYMEGYQSGQMGRAVNPLTSVFEGSNPSPSTIQ